MRRITSFGRSSSWELQVAGLWGGRGEHIRDMLVSGQSSDNEVRSFRRGCNSDDEVV